MTSASSSLSSIKGPSLKTFSGEPARSLVILLHGYGANGDDLLDLATNWQELLPHTEFIAPHAPTHCAINPSPRSYQWFNLDNLNQETIQRGVKGALPSLHAFIDDELKQRNLAEEQLMLVGFSQGTMMALATALNRSKTCAGVLGYSGACILPPSLEILSRPNIFLVHGDEDELISVENMTTAAQNLTRLGANVRSFISMGAGHFIDSEGLIRGGQFLAQHLNSEQQLDTKQD